MKKIVRTYGPYTYKSGNRLRRLVIHVYDDGTRRTQSNARYLLERHLGRPLRDDEDADHIDGDPLNDDLRNLRPLDSSFNRKLGGMPPEMYHFRCPACGNAASARLSKVRANWKQGKKGPFCSRSCAARSTYVLPVGPHGQRQHKETCKYGHPKEGLETRADATYRRCKVCARERARRRRILKKMNSAT